jgi:hypothetical protein
MRGHNAEGTTLTLANGGNRAMKPVARFFKPDAGLRAAPFLRGPGQCIHTTLR